MPTRVGKKQLDPPNGRSSINKISSGNSFKGTYFLTFLKLYSTYRNGLFGFTAVIFEESEEYV